MPELQQYASKQHQKYNQQVCPNKFRAALVSLKVFTAIEHSTQVNQLPTLARTNTNAPSKSKQPQASKEKTANK